jgi:N-acetylneuraminic acid mutarotase
LLVLVLTTLAGCPRAAPAIDSVQDAAAGGPDGGAGIAGAAVPIPECAAATGRWETLSVSGAPPGSYQNAAVFAGTEVLVWGGLDDSETEVGSGGAYDVASDQWRPLASDGAPVPRAQPSAVWTGQEMLVWGGIVTHVSRSGVPVFETQGTGGRYDPASDTWQPISTDGAPGPRFAHAAVWTGQVMLIWGGTNYQDGPDSTFGDGARYDPATDTWSPMSSRGAPSPRFAFPSVWTGTELVVWGAAYDPVADAWRPLSSVGAPAMLGNGVAAFWTGSEVLFFDGQYGGRYDPARDRWSAMAPSCFQAQPFVSVWTGQSLVAWGGTTPPECGDGGDACTWSFIDAVLTYNPASDAWSMASPPGSPGMALYEPSPLWTGTAMFLWGRDGDSGPQHAGLYVPE